MGEKDFQQEVIDRLARIETKQDATAETVKQNTTTINQHSIDITENRQSAKSAHHRIDGIFWGAGILGGVAGTVVNFIASVLGKGSGHG
ncbi:MAG: hypothetical protein PHQ46_11855 [Negativicutes bacterium]|nr:hypothetical protein [Negativicutes bacterium]